MVKLVRKNVFLDPEVLRRAQEILGAQSESEAIREALNLVAFRQEVMQGFDQVAGKVPDFRDMWEEQWLPLLFDTSVYVSIFRNAAFAAEFRPRCLRDIPLTYFSSVVVQELLAGACTPRQRRQITALYEPFERVWRIITTSHLVWKEVGSVVAVVLEKTPQFRSKLASGLLNDTLIALSGRSIGARVVTGNGQDFRLIQQFRDFALEIIDSESSAR